VLRAIYAAIHLIAEQPRGSPKTDMPDIRVKVLTRYRFKVLYTVVNDTTVEVIHIRHTSRVPWL
jgi:toxin ParE1/3/4